MIGTSRQYVDRLSREDAAFPEPEVTLKSGRVWSREAIEKWAKASKRKIVENG
jgi:predicted DNA-binding transcriptional regulator AlpA